MKDRRETTRETVTVHIAVFQDKVIILDRWHEGSSNIACVFRKGLSGGVGGRRPLHFLCVCVMLLMYPSGSAGSEGIELIAASAQARARAGTDVAVGDSALSQIENPATLALHRVRRIDFSGQFIIPHVHWSGPVQDVDSEVDIIPLGNMAVAIPLDDRLVLGAAFHSKSGLATRFRSRHVLIPHVKRRTGSDFKDMDFSLSIGYRLTDKLAVGIGARAEVATAEFSLVLGPADVEFGRGYAYGGGVQLGLHYQATERLALGLAYRSPTWFGDLRGGTVEASLLGLPSFRLGHGRLEDVRLPQRISAGAAWDVTDRLKLVGELRWINYSNSSFSSFTVSTGGLVDMRIPLPLGYKDMLVSAIGAEFKVDDDWTVGVGYSYGTQPVSSTNVLPGGSVISQHHVTVGLRFEKRDWWVGCGYVLAFRNSISGGGRSKIPFGFDYALSSIEQTQHSISVGFGFSF